MVPKRRHILPKINSRDNLLTGAFLRLDARAKKRERQVRISSAWRRILSGPQQCRSEIGQADADHGGQT
jgi:hypothetical protein